MRPVFIEPNSLPAKPLHSAVKYVVVVLISLRRIATFRFINLKFGFNYVIVHFSGKAHFIKLHTNIRILITRLQ